MILTYSSGTSDPMAISYDAECTGSSGWRYDNRATPTRVVLCPSTCSTVQADPKAILNMGFACEQVIRVILQSSTALPSAPLTKTDDSFGLSGRGKSTGLAIVVV